MWFVQQPITKIHKLPAWYRLSLVPGPACTGEHVELVFWLLALVFFPRRSEMSSPHALLKAWLCFCGRGVLNAMHFGNTGEERG